MEGRTTRSGVQQLSRVQQTSLRRELEKNIKKSPPKIIKRKRRQSTVPLNIREIDVESFPEEEELQEQTEERGKRVRFAEQPEYQEPMVVDEPVSEREEPEEEVELRDPARRWRRWDLQDDTILDSIELEAMRTLQNMDLKPSATNNEEEMQAFKKALNDVFNYSNIRKDIFNESEIEDSFKQATEEEYMSLTTAGIDRSVGVSPNYTSRQKELYWQAYNFARTSRLVEDSIRFAEWFVYKTDYWQATTGYPLWYDLTSLQNDLKILYPTFFADNTQNLNLPSSQESIQEPIQEVSNIDFNALPEVEVNVPEETPISIPPQDRPVIITQSENVAVDQPIVRQTPGRRFTQPRVDIESQEEAEAERPATRPRNRAYENRRQKEFEKWERFDWANRQLSPYDPRYAKMAWAKPKAKFDPFFPQGNCMPPPYMYGKAARGPSMIQMREEANALRDQDWINEEVVREWPAALKDAAANLFGPKPRRKSQQDKLKWYRETFDENVNMAL